ncbi:MAG: histidine--tRNA ligase [Chthoniobacterales bacterium]
MQPLPGFRDFLPNDCAFRNAIFARWREVCRGYGFVEWDAPVLEPTELYTKKSGPEIVGQLFNFTDKGEREVAMRPELTPSIARVVAAHEREFRKPLKWFSIPQCFRYEKQQRGRLREHYQLNCDLIGDASLGADVEIIGLCIDLLRAFGLGEDDFVVRVSDRRAWIDYLSNEGVALTDETTTGILSVIDKLDRTDPSKADRDLRVFGTSLETVRKLLTFPEDYFDGFNRMRRELVARGIGRYVRITPGIVRGLTYYTGFVFEVFDKAEKFRAIAGGGRYDNLVHQLSDGAASLPAVGFAMGDVVLGELISEVPAAAERMAESVKQTNDLDLYLVIAKEERRENALSQLQQLRDAGWRVDFPLAPAKVGKQFQTAEALGAKVTLLYGDEWPLVKMKTLATRKESLVPQEEIFDRLAERFAELREARAARP